MAITNHKRVGKALDLLKDGLQPFAQREMKAQHAQLWLEQAQSAVADTQTHLFTGKDGPQWDAASFLSGTDPLAERASKKLNSDELLIASRVSNITSCSKEG
jgi:hypothetical protein